MKLGEIQMSERRRCFCGGLARLETSWTKDNPGRRFWACHRKRQGCGYFDWFDPQMCVRSRMIIPGLLKRIDKAEGELRSSRRREKLLWFFMVIALVIAVLPEGSSGKKTVLELA